MVFFCEVYIQQSIFIGNQFFKKIVLSPEQLALVIPRHCKNFGFSFNHYIIFQRHLLIYYLSVLILNLLFLLSLHMYFAPTIHCIVCTFFSLLHFLQSRPRRLAWALRYIEETKVCTFLFYRGRSTVQCYILVSSVVLIILQKKYKQITSMKFSKILNWTQLVIYNSVIYNFCQYSYLIFSNKLKCWKYQCGK